MAGIDPDRQRGDGGHEPAGATRGARALDRSLLSGLAWTGAARWLSQVLAWAVTLVVARLLRPEDYGLMGMAMVLLGLVQLVTEFGLGAAVIIHQDLPPRKIRQLHAAALLLGLGAVGVCLAAARLVAAFFGRPEVTWIVWAMSPGFVIGGLRIVPVALLDRDLRFRTRALIDGAQSLVTSAATLLLALLHPSYWALVGGALAGQLAATAGALAARPVGLARPRFGEIARTLRLSSHILVSRLSWYGYSRADSVVAGRLLGSSELGAYTMAMTLASLPLDKIVSLVNQVSRSVIARVQGEPGELRRYFLHLSAGLALVTFPLSIGLATVAGDFVPLVLGSHWMAAVAPLRILALYAAYRCVTPLLPVILNVRGHSAFAMIANLAALLLLPAGFIAGSRHGIAGIATAWLVCHPLVTLPLFHKVFRELDLGLRSYLGALAPALAGSAAVVAGVLGVAGLLPGEPSWTVLVAKVGTGAVAYGTVLVLGFGTRLGGYWATLKNLRAAS